MFPEGVCRWTPRILTEGIPHIDNIIVSTASQEATIWRPFESTYVEGVWLEALGVKMSRSGVVVVNVSRLWARGEQVAPSLPGQAAHSRAVRAHTPNQLGGIHIPEL